MVERKFMKKISFYTFGCRLNQSETASIQNSFEHSGYQVVGFDEPSDIVVINTCTVTEGGDADTRHLVHKVNRLNPAGPYCFGWLSGSNTKRAIGHICPMCVGSWVMAEKWIWYRYLMNIPEPETAQACHPDH